MSIPHRTDGWRAFARRFAGTGPAGVYYLQKLLREGIAMQTRKFSTYDLVVVGVMAAVIFAATMFLKIGPIPTPAGPTQFKVANALCLLGGMLFGGVRGGLAAGIGSMFFDLCDPAFAASAPFTLVFFFAMAFVCGAIANAGGREGKNFRWNLMGAVAGSATYLVLHLGKSLIVLMLEGSDFSAALVTCALKFITSGANALFAVVVSVLIAAPCRSALVRAGLERKLFPKNA